MSLIDLIYLSQKSLRSNILRSVLTSLGIIIGVNLAYAVYAFIFLSAVPLIYQLILTVFKRFNWYEPLNTSSENTSMNIFLENSEVEKILSEKTVVKFLKDLDQNNDLNQSSLNLVFDII